jgi:MoaA/NifB/PqqE/SkfB family radical SAM enzyme/phosphatidylserine synthase
MESVRFLAAQLLTASRIVLAAGALLAVGRGNFFLAATLITFGIVTDGCDGVVARKLGKESEFGALFDYFADYLCYIVAPWTLSLRLLQPGSWPATAVMTLPLVTGAVRYARNANRLKTESFEQQGFPGLLTVFYTLTLVALVFLGWPGGSELLWPLAACTAALSLLMVSPIRYPKLTRSKSVFIVVYVTLCVMPFAFTSLLASVTLGLVFAYVLCGPFLVRQESLRDYILRAVAARRIVRCLTGRPDDLRRLLQIPRIGKPGPAFQALLKRLGADIDNQAGIANLLLHIGKFANPVQKRKLTENLILNWAVKGARIRTALSTPERWIPFFVVVSPTMRCNLNCRGCYSALYSKEGELSREDMDGLFTQCEQLGAYFSVISGGEPYLLKETLLALFARHHRMFFLTFTNGTLLDEATIDQLGRLGNVVPAISVEGYEQETDRRRSPGVYAKAAHAMRLLRERGVLFGISVTYTSENLGLVTRDEFIDYYVKQGATFAWYFMFMPIGADPVLELVPSPEQRLACGKRVVEMRRRYPIFIGDFWNDGPAIGGCLAGGRRYLHILNSGRVEPCVFAHFGVDNIRDKTLLEAANSEFFQAIRRAFPYSETGNLRRPCLITDHPQVLRRLIDEHLVPGGHEHSEDLIRDPRVSGWLDNYAQRMADLTDAEWEKRINDPSDRWYRETPEFQNMFRFQKPARR